MKNAVLFIALTLVLSSCADRSPEHYQRFSQHISEKYTVGSDERILIRDLEAQHFKLVSRGTQRINGSVGWKELFTGAGNLFDPAEMQHVVWRADNNGKILEIRAYAYHNNSSGI